MILYLTPKIVGPAIRENAQGLLQVARMTGQTIAFFTFTATAAWHFRRWPLVSALAALAVGLLVAASGASQPNPALGYGMLAAGYGIIGLASGMAFTMCSYYTLGLFRTKGLGSGTMETLIGAGGFLGPLAAGELAARTSPRTALLAALLPLALAALVALPWERRLGTRTR